MSFFTRLVNTVLLSSALLFFTSCLLPEKFTCNILINEDGSYSLAYKGTVVDYRALAAISDGSFDDKEYESMVPDYNSNNQFAVIRYKGNGRIYVEFSKNSQKGATMGLFSDSDMITITRTVNYVYVKISATDTSTSDGLSGLDYKIDGTINITSLLPVEKEGSFTVSKTDNVYHAFKKIDELSKEETMISFKAPPVSADQATSDRKQSYSNDWTE